ncbi:MAG: ATP-binding cassette domain-containing protein [Patescibacteria group bacterium]|nr:ATP-binding cassette domain-containing protein [Patescibacteria group bacterium]
MIKLHNVSKKISSGTPILSDISFDVEKGEFVFLVGPTGSGKTTLFKLLIREILPTEGTIIVGDWDIVRLPKKKIPHLRKKIGIVFQDLKLLMDRTIFENIVLPLELTGIKDKDALEKVEEVLLQVGIEKHRNKFPIQLSGGEKQRAAIARALILSPDIFLADEPTADLDPKTSQEIVDLLVEINKKGTTVIMATHNASIVDTLERRVIALESGKIVRDQKKGKYGSS